MNTIVYEAIERQPIEVDLDEILIDGKTLDILPQIKSKGFFDIDFRGNKLILVAGKHIGHIPINERVILQIRPKFSINNLVRIISCAQQRIQYLDFFRRGYQTTAATEPTIFEFLCACLASELKVLAREGVLRQYERKTANSSYPKGRISIDHTLTRNWPKASYHRVFISHYELGYDLPVNQLIKFALWYCMLQFPRLRIENLSLLRELTEFYNYFGSVSLDRSRAFVAPAIQWLENDKVPIIRRYYESVIRICQMIVDDIGVELRYSGEDIELSSFVIDLESVFERYLRNILRASSLLISKGAQVLDGNAEGRGYLFCDTNQYEAKPDIVIRYGQRTTILIDAKYKESIKESDRYQIIAHGLAFNAKSTILVIPRPKGTAPGLHRLGRVSDLHTLDVFLYRFDLAANDLISEETAFISAISEIIS